MASITRVEAYKRHGVTGRTEHVAAYLRKQLESFGAGDGGTRRGAFAGPERGDPVPPEAVNALRQINPVGRPSPPATGTVEDPIDVGGDYDIAVRYLADGKHVRLNRPAEVPYLLDRLKAYADEIEARGEESPTFNLCAITVPGTNLFCQESHGVPRAQMPQLSGIPTPGSPGAARLKPGQVKLDIAPDFRDALVQAGIGVRDTRVKAIELKVSQNELDGAKVASMAKRMLNENSERPIFVTRDGYIIDGHHRWAANVVNDSRDNELGDITMPVEVVDLDIGAALDFANAFAAKMGIRPKQLGEAWVRMSRAEKPYVALRDLGKRREIIRLATITRVEAHKRRGAKGQTEHVHSYLRTVHDAIDSMGGPKLLAQRGINTSVLEHTAQKAERGEITRAEFDAELESTKKYAAEKEAKMAAIQKMLDAMPPEKPKLPTAGPLQGDDVRRAIHVVDETDEERDAIDSYVGIYYSELNNWKRGRGPEIDWAGPGSGDYIRHMDGHLQDVFGRLPGTDADVAVWRGRRSDPNWHLGDELVDPAYASTSSDRSIAEHFAGLRGAQGPIMKVVVPKGSKLLDEKEHGDENAQALSWEKALLLPAGTHFEITGITNEHGRKVYTMAATTPKMISGNVSLAADGPTPPPPPKTGGPDRKAFKEADGDWDPEVIKKAPVQTSDIDLDSPAMVYLSLITRVQAYKRRGVSGKTEHVGSYVRRVNDLINSMGGPKVAAKSGINVNVLKGEAIKAEHGEISDHQFEQRLDDATVGPDLEANARIDRKYAPVWTPTYPTETPKVDGVNWVNGVNKKTGEPEIQMTDAGYDKHVAEVQAKLDANKHLVTADMYSKKVGKKNVYNLERAQAHRQIISDLIDQAKARGVKANHRGLMSGGLGGSGKSTTLGNPKTGLNKDEYIEVNPDSMKDELVKRGMVPLIDGVQPMEEAALIHDESSDLAKELAAEAVEQGLDLMWDITMASRGSVQERLDQLKAHGYNTKAVFVDIPVDDSIKRALGRHRGGVESYLVRHDGLGGRFVDPKHIQANRTDNPKYWSKNRQVFDGLASPTDPGGGPDPEGQFQDWQVWDNSGKEPVLVKQMPIGTRRKWADGYTYVKMGNDKWVRYARQDNRQLALSERSQGVLDHLLDRAFKLTQRN